MLYEVITINILPFHCDFLVILVQLLGWIHVLHALFGSPSAEQNRRLNDSINAGNKRDFMYARGLSCNVVGHMHSKPTVFVSKQEFCQLVR